MKKLSTYLLMFISVFIFSCEKDNEEVVQPTQQDNQLTSNLPNFDETNIPHVSSWKKLPAILRDAPSLTFLKSKSVINNARLASWSEYSFKYGPFGKDKKGDKYDFKPTANSRIYAIAVTSGRESGSSGLTYIKRLYIWYETEDREVYYGGEPDGSEEEIEEEAKEDLYYIFLSEEDEDEDEHLQSVNGYINNNRVSHLGFKTNNRTINFGKKLGQRYYAEIPDGYQILGFFGYYDDWLNSIGYYCYTYAAEEPDEEDEEDEE